MNNEQLKTNNNQPVNYRPTLKNCAACGNSFECNAADIVNCQCYAVKIPAHAALLIKGKYDDCLCADCLRQIIRQQAGGQEHL